MAILVPYNKNMVPQRRIKFRRGPHVQKTCTVLEIQVNNLGLHFKRALQ